LPSLRVNWYCTSELASLALRAVMRIAVTLTPAGPVSNSAGAGGAVSRGTVTAAAGEAGVWLPCLSRILNV